MKMDLTRAKLLVLAMATAAAATFVWTGCDSHDDDDHSHGTDGGGGHTSPYPSCNAITQACHEVDVGEGEIHDCHDQAHGAKSDSDCAPVKDRCLQICAAAKADGGATDHEGHDGGDGGDGGEEDEHDGGQ